MGTLLLPLGATDAGGAVIVPLASFNGSGNGSTVIAGAVRDSAGNLYTAANKGGAQGDGTVAKLPFGSSQIQVLATFNGSNGQNPFGAPILDGNGNLYGTTHGNGSSTFGTIYNINLSTGTLTTLASFNNANGRAPVGRLVRDGAGNLYGVCQRGGAGDAGTVFELVAGGNTPTVIASFDHFTTGFDPEGGMIFGPDGSLYGTTFGGGPNDKGVLYKIAPGSHTISPLAFFGGINCGPMTELIMDAAGNFYGSTTGITTSNAGTIFELESGSSTFTTLATFTGSNGDNPALRGHVFRDGDNLYGTTFYGTALDKVTVFQLNLTTHALSTIATFTGPNGSSPEGVLATDGQGNLFGTTFSGGDSDAGVIFEITGVPEPAAPCLLVLALAGLEVRNRSRRNGPAPQ